MAITDEDFEEANRRGAVLRSSFPKAISVKYDRRVARIVVAFTSGLEIAFSPRSAQGLENGRPTDFSDAEITPSGLGIHFPHLDADIDLPTLLQGLLGSKVWMAAEIGKIGGAKSSPAKTAAARQNGKLGGRPRKNKTLLVA